MEIETMNAAINGVTAMVAITGIVVLDSIALMNGINGTLFTLAMVTISGIAGYEIKDVLKAVMGGKK